MSLDGNKSLGADSDEKPLSITVADLKSLLSENILLVDIRELNEVTAGVLPSAHVVPGKNIKEWLGSQNVALGARLVLYCASGQRSAKVVVELRKIGYCNAFSLEGGVLQWLIAEEMPEDKAEITSAKQLRFSRQILLPEVGLKGQVKISRARVLVVGAGGLGSACLYYLAAAGVGKLGIVDPDTVEKTNLHRQILYGFDDIGNPKVFAAQARLLLVNPDLDVEINKLKLSQSNVMELLDGYQVVIDCTDNFEARYALNDAAIQCGIPLIHGAAALYRGTLGVFNLHGGPCYRCVYPEPPPSHLSPACSEVGVLGVVPGMIGVMQAAETLKTILELRKDESHQLICFDALTMSFNSMGISLRKGCLCEEYRRGNNRE